jgi:hypothetical protein
MLKWEPVPSLLHPEKWKVYPYAAVFDTREQVEDAIEGLKFAIAKRLMEED